jgi:tetratricopeptide (TPR) repeat protein
MKPLLQSRETSEYSLDNLLGGQDYQQAQDAAQAGDLDTALSGIDHAIDALRFDPVYSRYFTLRGSIHSQKNNLDAAKADFMRALAIDPADGEARSLLCQLLQDQERYLEALTLWRLSMDRHRDLAFFIRQADLEIHVRDFAGAQDSLAQAIQNGGTAHEHEVVKSWQVKLAVAEENHDYARELQGDMDKDRPSKLKVEGVLAPPDKEPESGKKKPVINWDIIDPPK